MGICESTHQGREPSSVSQKTNPSECTPKTEDENNSNNLENNSTNKNKKEKDNKSSISKEVSNKKSPELAKYEPSMFYSGKRSEFSHLNNKTASIFSTGQTEEEVIIRGEINKNCQNKEEDFDNISFLKLVKNNGGIILKNGDINSNFCSSRGIESILNRKKAISEIKSKRTFPFANYKNIDFTNGLRGSGKKSNYNRNKLRDNNKINVAMNEGSAIVDSYLIIPKSDDPLPDIDELSTESPILIESNSLISS